MRGRLRNLPLRGLLTAVPRGVRVRILLSGGLMKLSEAIRKGAALRPQCFETYKSRDSLGNWSTCALGAAYEAVTGELPTARGGGVVRVLEQTIGTIAPDVFGQ